MQYLKFTLIPLFALLASGCTKTPPVNDARITSIVSSRIGNSVQWNELHKDKEVQSAILHLTKQVLTPDTAVEIALLNNPKIQATFENLGVAQADLVQAGLFQNPIFDGFVRFQNRRAVHVNTEFSVVQNFLDIFLIPLRKKVAEAEFEQAQLHIANAILDLSFEVRKTYYSLVAEQKKLHLARSLVEALHAAYLLAKEQRKCGNINTLELEKRMNEYLEAALEFTRMKMDLVRLKEKMNTLLGFSTAQNHLKIKAHLPGLPPETSSIILEKIALEKRLDLEIARWEIERIARLGATKSWWSYTDAAAGISAETDPEGNHVIGPSFSTKLPIFNYGEADRARLLALYRQSKEQLKALEIEILSEVRTSCKELQIMRTLVLSYRKKLLPLQAKIVSTSQKFYNVMGLSVYKLLDEKKQELHMQMKYMTALGNYWMGRVSLDRALGGKLYLATSAKEKIAPLQKNGVRP